jgi:hypothetical protein
MAPEQLIAENEDDCQSDELEDLNVAEEWIARIDATLLAHTTKEFRKVAKIVDLAMKSLLDAPENLTECFYSRRIAHLVRSGQMESQGNLRRMRSGEVRLPGPPLTTSELAELVAQGDYWKLGCIYSDGQGVAQDYVEALKWFRIGAEQGHVWSQFNVGRFYMNGYGVPKNFKHAYLWIGLAVNRSADMRPLRHWLEKAASELAPPERAQLDKHIAAWRPTQGLQGIL